MCGIRQEDDVSDFMFEIVLVLVFGEVFAELSHIRCFSSLFFFSGSFAKFLSGKLQKLEVFAWLTFQL